MEIYMPRNRMRLRGMLKACGYGLESFARIHGFEYPMVDKVFHRYCTQPTWSLRGATSKLILETIRCLLALPPEMYDAIDDSNGPLPVQELPEALDCPWVPLPDDDAALRTLKLKCLAKFWLGKAGIELTEEELSRRDDINMEWQRTNENTEPDGGEQETDEDEDQEEDGWMSE